MKPQGIKSSARSGGAGLLRWFGLGFTLMIGIAVVMLIMVVSLTPSARSDSAASLNQDTARALLIYRAGEWRLYEDPNVTPQEGWQRYRAGERAPQTGEPIAIPDGWQQYRAGERE